MNLTFFFKSFYKFNGNYIINNKKYNTKISSDIYNLFLFFSVFFYKFNNKNICFFVSPRKNKNIVYLRAPYKNKLARLNVLSFENNLIFCYKAKNVLIPFKDLDNIVIFFENYFLNNQKLKHSKTKIKLKSTNTNNFSIKEYN